MADELDDILDRAQAKTDKQLRGEMEKLACVSEKDLEKIIPAGMDKVKVRIVMAVVRDAALSNEKKAEALRSIAGLSEIAIGLAAKVAKA